MDRAEQISESFDKTWEAWEITHGEKVAQQQGIGLDQARAIIREWRDIAKETQRKIAVALGPKLADPKDNLLDLFSGPAIVPYALQHAGLVDRLSLLDHDPWAQFKDVYHTLPGRLGLPKTKVTNRVISGESDFDMDKSPQVTLIDTGLGLPYGDREDADEQMELFQKAQLFGITQVRKAVPDALTRGHIFELEMNTVLRLLSNAERRVFVIEQAKRQRRNALEAVSNHLARIARVSPGWEISGVEPLDDNGLVLAELEHKVV